MRIASGGAIAAPAVPHPPAKSRLVPALLALVTVALLAVGWLFYSKPATPETAALPQASPASAPQPAPASVLPPTAIEHFRQNLEKSVEIEGVVVSIGESKSGRTHYINFSRRPGETISLALRASDMNVILSESALQKLPGAKVRARGRVTEFNGDLLLYIEKAQDVQSLP